MGTLFVLTKYFFGYVMMTSLLTRRWSSKCIALKMALKKLRFLAAVFAVFCVYAVGQLLYVLFVILRNPRRALKRTARDIPPACLLDAGLGTHEYVIANGLKFHCVCAGDTSKPLMLLLHGFPEFWFSWRHQLRAFCKDYHVVAVDMRGYGDTDQPEGSSQYSFHHLTQDIAELVPALGHSSCVLVGHDWGGVVSWRLTQRHPELVDRLIVLNCPHGRVFKKYLENSWTQLRRSWFVFFFQIPRLPEALLSLQDYQFLEDLFTSHTSGVRNREQFPAEVVEAYKYTFSRPGALTGPINYYRAMFSSPKDSLPREKWTIPVPTLIIWGDDDHVLQREMADCHDTICPLLTVKHIPNCSHWVQQDMPDVVNQCMSDFLATH